MTNQNQEKNRYRTILKHAWYIDRFNHKELAHRFLASEYLKGNKILEGERNTSYLMRGLKWMHRDMWVSERRHREGVEVDWAPVTTNNSGEALVDLHALNLFVTCTEDRTILKLISRGYTPSEIGIIMETTRQNISNKLTRIRNKLHENGETL